jgi:hypothetical protein
MLNLDLDFFPSRMQLVKKAPDPGSATLRPNPKSLTGGLSRLWHGVKVDSGVVAVLESTLEWL